MRWEISKEMRPGYRRAGAESLRGGNLAGFRLGLVIAQRLPVRRSGNRAPQADNDNSERLKNK